MLVECDFSCFLLEEEARKEGIGKSVLARKLLIEALAERRIKRAIEEYLEGKCSLGYAASIAKLSIRGLSSRTHQKRICSKVYQGEFREE